MKKLLLLALAAVLLLPVAAKVRLPQVLGDHMVLQQNTSVKLWGWADKGRSVTVRPSWDAKTYTTRVAADGTWMVEVTTPAGGFTPYTIAISDGDPLTLHDVLVGEVWICSGQSNMEMPLAGNPGQPIDGSLSAIVRAGDYKDRIRFTTLKRQSSATPMDDASCEWFAAAPATAGRCSAAGYFFARQVSDVLGVPVGLVINSWGNSNIESWMTPAMLAKVEGADIAKVSDPELIPNRRLEMLYNGMLMPVHNYTARGFLWYQGEANLVNPQIYAPMMTEMVAAWRALWGDAQMPFYYVQIAPYRYSGNANTEAALVREAQQEALKTIPRSGMITLMDAGNEFCIHPPQKDVAGERLAVLALTDTYGMEGFPTTGPSFAGVTYADGRAVVTLDGAPKGLMPENEDLPGFEIAGADRKFYAATARIVRGKNTIELRSDAVAEPVAVRYAFANNPGRVTLSNTFGLSAAPFRTDNW